MEQTAGFSRGLRANGLGLTNFPTCTDPSRGRGGSGPSHSRNWSEAPVGYDAVVMDWLWKRPRAVEGGERRRHQWLELFLLRCLYGDCWEPRWMHHGRRMRTRVPFQATTSQQHTADVPQIEKVANEVAAAKFAPARSGGFSTDPVKSKTSSFRYYHVPILKPIQDTPEPNRDGNETGAGPAVAHRKSLRCERSMMRGCRQQQQQQNVHFWLSVGQGGTGTPVNEANLEGRQSICLSFATGESGSLIRPTFGRDWNWLTYCEGPLSS